MKKIFLSGKIIFGFILAVLMLIQAVQTVFADPTEAEGYAPVSDSSIAEYEGGVEIIGHIIWDDYSNVMATRPRELDINVYRYADSQEGQDNAIDKTLVSADAYNIEWDDIKEDTWTYKIDGADLPDPDLKYTRQTECRGSIL
jgi:hypothetical protein